MKAALFTLALVFGALFLSAQDTLLYPSMISQPLYFDTSPALHDLAPVPPQEKSGESREIPNRIGKRELGQLKTAAVSQGGDPALQSRLGPCQPNFAGPLTSFDGMINTCACYPPDPQGDVGPGHYMQVVNLSFSIYSKAGAVLYGPADLSTIWTGIPAPWNGTNDGDPIVLYDQTADRWLISQFSLPPGGTAYAVLVAVSATGDPLGTWYRYVFNFGNRLPDYPKLGVWPDGYYLSANLFENAATWAGVTATVLQRSKMLLGDPTAFMISFSASPSSDPYSILPADWDGTATPAAGEPNWFAYYNDWSSPTDRYLRIWALHTDWTTPVNSTFTQVASLVTAPFNSELCGGGLTKCIPQPGTSVKLDAMNDRLMFRLQYRQFSGYSAMVTNHTVNADGSGQAGVRWYELRNTGSGWGIHQQGTYAPADGRHRWMGSIAMNADGTIALGYSVSDGVSTYPGIRYTARKATDPAGMMTLSEQTLIAGGGSQTGSVGRWGDYSMMSVDESTNHFWYTNEYYQTTSTNSWKTRIGEFAIDQSPYAATQSANPVQTTSATLRGSVIPSGLPTNYYFEYGPTAAYGYVTPTGYAGTSNALFSVNTLLTGLTTGTLYHYRTAAYNADGTAYGDDMTFIPGAASVTTALVTNLTGTSAVSGGVVIQDGGSPVTSRGVCWGLTANPTLSGPHTVDGSGTGAFVSTLAALMPGTTYYLRAYATNSNGTWYGNSLTLTTPCASYTLPFYEGFNNPVTPYCWTQVDHQGNGQIWAFGTIGNSYSPAPVLNGNYAYLNSDAYGNLYTQNADLVTPPLDFTGYSSAEVTFSHFYRNYPGQTGTFSYSLDNVNWNPVAVFTVQTANPELSTVSIAGAAGASQVRFKWNFTGTWGWFWAIDDIMISGVPMNRELRDITVLDGATVCYSASQVITVAGAGTTFQVEPGGVATLIAGQAIHFYSGTKVDPGGYLSAMIAPSGPFCSGPGYQPVFTGTDANATPEPSLTTPAVNRPLFSLHPNPNSGRFLIEFHTEEPADEQAAILIYSPAGEVVYRATVMTGRPLPVRLESGKSGLYIIRVKYSNRQEALKFIITP